MSSSPRKVAVLGTLIVAGVMCVFPPWLFYATNPYVVPLKDGVILTDMGYGFLLSPPDLVPYLSEAGDYDFWEMRMNWSRLVLQLGALTFLGAAVAYALPTEKTLREKRRVQRSTHRPSNGTTDE